MTDRVKWSDASPAQRRRGYMILAGAVLVFVPFFGYLFSYQPPDEPAGGGPNAAHCAKVVGVNDTGALARCIALREAAGR